MSGDDFDHMPGNSYGPPPSAPGPTTSFFLSQRRHPGIRLSPPCGKENDPSDIPNLPGARNLLRRERVPQSRCTGGQQTIPPIYFSFREMQGINLHDMTTRNLVIDNARDQPLVDTNATDIMFGIYWPGYEPFCDPITVRTPQGTINRLQLARAVAASISRFFNDVADKQMPKVLRQWSVGERGIRFEDVWLMSVEYTQGGIWIAQLDVLAEALTRRR
ncbi:hypothetical protein JAAARDRAFT_205814 [Jaapia argillacea MUCL 33604]|uniref:Uncharacterized protein n=1 Tax=Jaapia argillacea MUCL 33604 TaxID=933084 RepID=A0A067Q8N9_9AGAM|nr:hypothetical protein JAAARDRAFT_205814 [Jaapia argillacea MUCL 33604]